MKFSKLSPRIIVGILVIVIIFSVSLGFAHQPRLASYINSMDNPILVQNPEVSQAFYGQLEGNPAYYLVRSNSSFQLYINILVPDNPGAQLMSVEISNSSGRSLAKLDANTKWEPYFEKFGGDGYLKGPEFNQTMPAGDYYIKVFNAQNQGKYSLAIGDIETFPPSEALNAIFLLPILKAQIFEVPVFELFIQFIGLIMAIGSLMVICILLKKSKDSVAILVLTRKVYSSIKPLMLLGVGITSLMWILTYLKNTFNILGFIETLLLIVILLMHFNIHYKLKKLYSEKIPFKRIMVLLILWILFLFLRIVLIDS